LNKPFHLSFVVPDLRLTQAFYINILDCKKGRDTGQWLDIIFFGHQLTLHQESTTMVAQAIDHFGVILNQREWLSLITKLKTANIAFELEPSEKLNDDNSQAGKFAVKDPANNLLEFKFYQPASINSWYYLS